MYMIQELIVAAVVAGAGVWGARKIASTHATGNTCCNCGNKNCKSKKRKKSSS